MQTTCVMITSSYVLKAGICTAAIFIGRARGRSQAGDKQRSKATHFLQDLNLSRRRAKSHETLIWLSSQFLCDNVHRANWVFAWAYDSIPGFIVTVFQTIITEAWHASRDGLPLEKRKISKFWDVKEGRKEGRKEETNVGKKGGVSIDVFDSRIKSLFLCASEHFCRLFVCVSRIARPSERNWVGLYEGGVRYGGHCCFQYM